MRDVILFLAANPSCASDLALGKEYADIQRVLQGAPYHDFDLIASSAASVDEFVDHLNAFNPTILHFSGHGARSSSAPIDTDAAQRDIVLGDASGSGIYFQNEHGPRPVPARALMQLIRCAAASARVVVLNACYSDAQAEALSGVVDCVIGMTGAISDDAARSFATGFYRAIGHRCSVGNAYEQGRATLSAKQMPDEHVLRCRSRDGVDLHRLILR